MGTITFKFSFIVYIVVKCCFPPPVFPLFFFFFLLILKEIETFWEALESICGSDQMDVSSPWCLGDSLLNVLVMALG